MNLRMDLHSHSAYSDGTFAPAEIVRMAAKAGIALLSLTDHDTLAGVSEAIAAGAQQGVLVLPGIEMDNESPFELHILGLDIDTENDALNGALRQTLSRRNIRNARMLEKLEALGCDVAGRVEALVGNGVATRMHIAIALRDAGYAGSVPDAFRRYLSPGAPAYCTEAKLLPREVIALIKGAGGVPVLAHPCHIRQNPHGVVRELAELGIMGLEAYYPASTLGQTDLFVSLAAQYRLMVTCGSDFHGKNREGTPLGCAWRDVECLRQTAGFFMQRHSE